MDNQSIRARIIGHRIERARRGLKLNQKDFAKILGISQSFLSKMESGAKMPDFFQIQSISASTGMSIDWLCSEEPVEGDIPVDKLLSLIRANQTEDISFAYSNYLGQNNENSTLANKTILGIAMQILDLADKMSAIIEEIGDKSNNVLLNTYKELAKTFRKLKNKI